jgi:hypothetical protein
MYISWVDAPHEALDNNVMISSVVIEKRAI